MALPGGDHVTRNNVGSLGMSAIATVSRLSPGSWVSNGPPRQVGPAGEAASGRGSGNRIVIAAQADQLCVDLVNFYHEHCG